MRPKILHFYKLPGDDAVVGQWTMDARIWQHRECLERNPKWVQSNCKLASGALDWEVCLDPKPYWTRWKKH